MAIGRAAWWFVGLVGLLGLASAGCHGTTGIESVPVHRPPSVPAVPTVGPRGVPAGTVIEVSLDQGLGTKSSHVNEGFSARVMAAVNGADGRVLVPQGGEVRGFVVALDDGFLPLIKIAFTTIDTVDGVAPLQARLISAARYAYVEQAPVGVPTSYDAILLEPLFRSGVQGNAPIGIGGGPVSERARTTRTELRVPAGADLRLELSAPLTPPAKRP